MSKMIHAILVDRNGFSKSMQVMFQSVIHIQTGSQFQVSYKIDEVPGVGMSAKEFYFERWLDKRI